VDEAPITPFHLPLKHPEMGRFLASALAILPLALKAYAGFVAGPSAVADKSYDFIVVGVGLCVAYPSTCSTPS